MLLQRVFATTDTPYVRYIALQRAVSKTVRFFPMATLRFYHDYLSQPARAVGLLLEVEKVPYEKRVLKLAEGTCS